jgi:hypothetical protein
MMVKARSVGGGNGAIVRGAPPPARSSGG